MIHVRSFVDLLIPVSESPRSLHTVWSLEYHRVTATSTYVSQIINVCITQYALDALRYDRAYFVLLKSMTLIRILEIWCLCFVSP